MNNGKTITCFENETAAELVLSSRTEKSEWNQHKLEEMTDHHP